MPGPTKQATEACKFFKKEKLIFRSNPKIIRAVYVFSTIVTKRIIDKLTINSG